MAVGVIGIVARCLVQLDIAQVRRDHRQVAALNLNIAQPAFERIAQRRAVGQPERQALAHQRVDDEEIKLFAQNAMIAFDRFFQPGAMIAQFLRRLPGGAVDARELLALFVTAPISAGRRTQRNADRLRIDLARSLDVRTAAEVGESVLRVDGQALGRVREGRAIVIEAPVDQVFDELQLVGLIMEELSRFRRRHLRAW